MLDYFKKERIKNGVWVIILQNKLLFEEYYKIIYWLNQIEINKFYV